MKINSNYNLYQNYNKPSFKRNWAEHASWGVKYAQKTKTANFKLFTFPDAKMVFVEIGKKAGENFGKIKERIIKILAAQGAGLVIEELLTKDDKTKLFPLENKGDGIFEASNIEAEENSQYRYIIVKNDNSISLVKDPYAKQQPHINGWSEIYNPDNYDWKAYRWLKGKDPRRIMVKPNDKFRGLENLIIEEINIPTLSEEGTFEKAKAHIDKVAAKGIANAIEIMPVENTYSLQWGYDGVDKFAVNSKMGTPAQLKELIDYAHLKGLNVIMDMVPNHVGPDGNYLTETGPYIKHAGTFGDVPNYEGKDNRYVRDWMANAALWWVNEFKVDGLRLDMTKFCESDYLLKQIACEIHEHNPGVFIIAEDGRDNKHTVTDYEQNFSHLDELKMIDENVDNITNRNWRTYPNAIGFDSEWDFPLMHELKELVLNPMHNNIDGLDGKIRNSRYRVKFVMSHDEIGNLDGTRLISKVITNELDLFNKVKGTSDAEKGQNAARLGQKLAELSLTTDITTISQAELQKKAREYGLADSRRITPQSLERAFNIAIAKQKLALGTIMTIPGPKMFFQGDDELDLSNFKFFRTFSSDKYRRNNDPNYISSIIAEKGYDTYEKEARMDSLLGKIKQTSGKHQERMVQYSKDLIQIFKENPVLQKGDIINTYKDTHNKVHIHHLKLDDEEVLVIKNFGSNFHSTEYGFANFPSGSWEEIFNSDSSIYGGSNFVNEHRGCGIHQNNQALNLAPNSIIILRKV